MIPLEERVLDLKKVLTDAETIKHPGSEELILAIKKLIRRNEIELILRDYFIKSCSFGYLLLQSQVIEEQLRDVMRGAESVLSKEGKTSLLPSKYVVEKQPLGELITRARDYIEYPPLFDSLEDFNRDRKLIIHHLIDDYSADITSLEREIIQKYTPEKVGYISIRILEVIRRINERMLNTTLKNVPDPDKAFIKNLSSRLARDLNLLRENIQLLF